MSVSSNKAPIQKIPHSNSNKSLFTENSQDSDHHPNDVPISRNHIESKAQQRKMQTSPKQNQERDNVPQLPTQTQNRPINNFHPNNPIIPGGLNGLSNQNRQMTPNHNTIAVSKPTTQHRYRSPYDEEAFHPHRITGLTNISKINEGSSERQRMLRSSQGGRWFRSQSLMNDKQKKSPQFMLRNYHRYESKYGDLLEKLMKQYQTYEKQLKTHYSHYGISLNDLLEQIKNKMELHLQKKIDLSNLPIDRPDGDWKQEDLTKFYSNYPQILLKKLSLSDSEGPQTIILKKYKNCVYYGPIKNSKKHGFGYIHYFSGRFFEGLFEEDQKIEGFQMDDSQLYVGKFRKNQRSGEGILKTNEHLIAGTFTGGDFSLPKQDPSQTKMNFNTPILGKMENTMANLNKKGFKIQFSLVTFYIGGNQGICKNNINDLYIGQLNEENEKNGTGLEIFANGDLYIGKYQQGIPEGYGEYYWESGAFYRGQFLSGMRHGKGKWMMVNGDKYEGDYLNDKKNGNGTYYWKTGDKYIGEFENDYRHGYGEMYWRDGTTYKGKWSNGIQVNKVVKLQPTNGSKNDRYAKNSNPTPVAKSSYKTIQPKKRGSVLSTSHNNGNIKNRVEEAIQNKRRVPLQKLKAMLNPSNSVN